jgi:hypothetical protein
MCLQEKCLLTFVLEKLIAHLRNARISVIKKYKFYDRFWTYYFWTANLSSLCQVGGTHSGRILSYILIFSSFLTVNWIFKNIRPMSLKISILLIIKFFHRVICVIITPKESFHWFVLTGNYNFVNWRKTFLNKISRIDMKPSRLCIVFFHLLI